MSLMNCQDPALLHLRGGLSRLSLGFPFNKNMDAHSSYLTDALAVLNLAQSNSAREGCTGFTVSAPDPAALNRHVLYAAKRIKVARWFKATS